MDVSEWTGVASEEADEEAAAAASVTAAAAAIAAETVTLNTLIHSLILQHSIKMEFRPSRPDLLKPGSSFGRTPELQPLKSASSVQ